MRKNKIHESIREVFTQDSWQQITFGGVKDEKVRTKQISEGINREGNN